MYFEYGEKEIEYLKSKDKKLSAAIDAIGHIYRETDSDLFTSIVKQIVGQQISAPAFKPVWGRVLDTVGDITAQNLCSTGTEQLQRCGLFFRKVSYIKDFAQKVYNGSFDVEKLYEMSDEDVIKELSALKGIGVWTAEMLMLFCMQRPDIVSFGDLAIVRGMRMLYRHRKIDRKNLKCTAEDIPLMGRWLPSICGQYRQVQLKGLPTLHLKRKQQKINYHIFKRFNMYYSAEYNSIIGSLLLVSDETSIAGLWMMGQKYFCPLKEQPLHNPNHPVLIKACRWLDDYFGGKKPDIQLLPLNP